MVRRQAWVAVGLGVLMMSGLLRAWADEQTPPVSSPQEPLKRVATLIMQGSYQQAVDLCTQLLGPQNAVAYGDRGDAHHNKGEHDLAIADYTQAITLEPKNAVAYLQRANTQFAKARYDQAIADYNQVITLEPQNAVAYCGRCKVYGMKRKQKQARADCDQSLALDPKYADAYLWSGYLYLDDKNYRQGREHLEKAARLDPMGTVGAAARTALKSLDTRGL